MKKNIKLRVNNLIRKYNTKNPYELCSKMNINIFYMELGEIKGYYKKVLKNKYIVINDKLDDYSKKIVLCHELGHVILHCNKKINFLKNNFLYYSNELENEANEFAAELLSRQYEILTDELIKECRLGITFLEEIKKLLKKK